MNTINYLFNARKVLERSRFPWVDYARGICIILVVYRHVFEGLIWVGEGSYSYPVLKYFNIFFFSFRMPLFFIVSGIFLGGSLVRKGIGSYVGNRFRNILYPLLIWGSLQVTLQLFFNGYVTAKRSPMDYLSLLIDPRKIEQFWYLNALFCVSVLYALIKHYGRFKPAQQLMLGIFMYAIAGYCHTHHIFIGFLLDVLFFYMFFAIGDMASDIVLNPKNYELFSSWKLLLAILPFFVLIQHYFTGLNLQKQDDYFVQFQRPEIFALAALTGGAFILNLSFILQRINVLKFLRVIGYHSLYIYVMHLTITAALRIVLTRVFHIENIPFLLIVSIIIGVLLPIILYNMAERAGAWWLFSLKKTSPGSKPLVKNSFFGAGMVPTPKESE
ncbi:MAG: acyltransferase [Chitinophagaceae bacterium]